METKLILKYFAVSTTAVVVWFGLSILWFRLWIWEQLPYPPKIVRLFLNADGEGAYDLVARDIEITIAGLLVVVFILAMKLRKTR
jgi:hypothetical protein